MSKQEKKLRVVSPRFRTVKETSEWLQILHWGHSTDDVSLMYGIKKDLDDNGKVYFVVVEIPH